MAKFWISFFCPLLEVPFASSLTLKHGPREGTTLVATLGPKQTAVLFTGAFFSDVEKGFWKNPTPGNVSRKHFFADWLDAASTHILCRDVKCCCTRLFLTQKVRPRKLWLEMPNWSQCKKVCGFSLCSWQLVEINLNPGINSMIASAQVGKSTTLCHLTFTQLLSLDAIAAMTPNKNPTSQSLFAYPQK